MKQQEEQHELGKLMVSFMTDFALKNIPKLQQDP